jgi:signal transduction histidine kinase
MRRGTFLLGAAALAFGLWAESQAFEWDQLDWWVPDLLVGWTLLGAAIVAWSARRSAAVGILLAATGAAWLVGFTPETLHLHRGPLVHLLVTYAGWRPRSRRDVVAVATGYAASVAAPVWSSEWASTALAVALAVLCGLGWWQASPRLRRQRRVAFVASGTYAAVVVGGAVARSTVPETDAVYPSLWTYQAVLGALAVYLVLRLPRVRTADLADLVVELRTGAPVSLRDSLARALDDPTLELGYWSAEREAYHLPGGSRLQEPTSGRGATYVPRGGQPYAVLVHEAETLREPRLAEAVARAVRLADSHRELRRQMERRYHQLHESRRRLVLAADHERRDLDRRLAEGPERRLDELGATLARLAAISGNPRVERAAGLLGTVRQDLSDLSRGLHPRDLESGGLRDALDMLARRSTVPAVVVADVPDLPTDVACTAYFVCAEALANVTKHAAASRVTVTAAQHATSLVLTVEDDGVGGIRRADLERGSGLQGLRDRVEALDGRIEVQGAAGGGTRVCATLPIRDEARA